MSLVKKLKDLADVAGVEYKKNAGEKKMKELLDEASVDYSDLDGEDKEPKGSSAPADEKGKSKMSPKKGREADEVNRIEGEKEGMFFLGNCVKTGEPLYKKLPK